MVLILVFVVVFFANCWTAAVASGPASSAANNEWNSRALLESYFNRIASRFDQLISRMDHLDNRFNRFSSLVQGRLDNIDSSLTTSKLKMGVWSEELNRIEDQLTRKWKNVESKIESLIPTLDSKVELRTTQLQRDNRRHNEHLAGLIAVLSQRLEISNDRVVSTLANFTNSERIRCPVQSSHSSPGNGSSHFAKSEDKLVALLEDFENRSTEVFKSGSTFLLTSSKVSNMFEDLIRRTDGIQTSVKDVASALNSTRRELADGFRALALSRRASSSMSSGSSLTSSETMSAVVVEALASVESMSTALGRRTSELSRSMEERFEMVSMTLNGFLESCVRIQDGAPLIEEHIATVLEKLLDAFDNNSRNSDEEFGYVRWKLDRILNGTTICESNSSTSSPVDDSTRTTTHLNSNDLDQLSRFDLGQGQPGSGDLVIHNTHDLRTAEILRHSKDLNLTEEEKANLWESLFLNQNVPD